MAYILGIDFGTKKLGLALLEPTTGVCMPHSVLPINLDTHQALLTLIHDYRVAHIVVGCSDSKKTSKKAQQFTEQLAHETHCSLSIVDENNTSKYAKSSIQESKRSVDTSIKKRLRNLDATSAVLILEDYAAQHKLLP